MLENIPEAEIGACAAHHGARSCGHHTERQSEIVLPHMHVHVALVGGLARCRGTAQEGGAVVTHGPVDRQTVNPDNILQF